MDISGKKIMFIDEIQIKTRFLINDSIRLFKNKEKLNKKRKKN